MNKKFNFNVKAEHRPKKVDKDAWYIVRHKNLLRPQLLWDTFPSKIEATTTLKNAISRGYKEREYSVIWGYFAIKYKIPLCTLSPFRNKREYSPYALRIKYLYLKEMNTLSKRKKFRAAARYHLKKEKNY